MQPFKIRRREQRRDVLRQLTKDRSSSKEDLKESMSVKKVKGFGSSESRPELFKPGHQSNLVLNINAGFELMLPKVCMHVKLDKQDRPSHASYQRFA